MGASFSEEFSHNRIPSFNVVTTALGAKLLKGFPRGFSFDIDSSKSYHATQGFVDHPISDKEGIIVELGNVYFINHIRFLLWDLNYDQRSYAYYIEISVDGQNWTRVIDYTAPEIFCWG